MMFIEKGAMVFLMVMVSCFCLAQPQTISGKHAQSGLTCAVCHETDAPEKRAPASVCMTCHGDYAAVAALTQKVVPNPHDSHQGELRCTLCHKSHEPSVLYCNECHSFDLQVK